MADFTLRGGHVIDPAQGIDALRDVIIRDGRIGSVVRPGVAARHPTDIDVSGAFVTPGLIDLHGHWYEGAPWGIDPVISLKSGVTTPVDAGTTGYENFGWFRRTTIETSAVGVLAFIHIGSLGLPSMNVGELEEFRYVRVGDTVEVIERHRDVIVGVKARLGTNPCGPNVLAAADAALDAAGRTGLPVMFHVSGGADLREIAPRMRAGDIMTHTFTAGDDGRGLLFDENGRIVPELWAARERGVVFDIGHGCGSFAFPIVRRAMDQGFEPTTISTDLHRLSIMGPAFDMVTTMAKLLHLGWPLSRVVEASAPVPARAIRREDELGSLREGTVADVAVFRVEEREIGLVDAFGTRESGRTRLTPVLTVSRGTVFRPETIEVRLRDYTAADYEVDCGAPLMSEGG
jgi:dihydroorotase